MIHEVVLCQVVSRGRYTTLYEVVKSPSTDENNIPGVPTLGTRGSLDTFRDYYDFFPQFNNGRKVDYKTGEVSLI